MKEPKDPTVEDIKNLATTDVIIKRCFSAFDIATQEGWEQALITALYFKTMICEATSEELQHFKPEIRWNYVEDQWCGKDDEGE